MAEALILIFLKKLGEQLLQEGELLSGVHDDIEWIKSELQAMVAFLKHADRRQETDERIEAWIGDVRNLVYDAEDIIDDFIIRVSQLRWNFVNHFRVRYRVASRIREIKKKVVEVKERRDRYGFQLDRQEVPASIRASSSGPGAASPFIQEDDIMGIEGDIEELSKLVLEGKSRRRMVLSVFGMGGLGKTTLVKEVFKRCKMRFDCFAWVFVSQSYNSRDVLRDILFAFKASEGQPAMAVMDVMNEGRLQEMTYRYLQDKHYLLVLDDIWDAAFWEELKHALPRNRGLIIFTTRIRDIASSAEDNCHVYDLQPLPHEIAREIFCRKAFRGNETCPEELKECTDTIVRRCGGLPLAIVAIGGLYSSKGLNKHEWQYVLDTLDSEVNLNRDLERLNKALLFSYIHLPFYLKYCFLYISLFPEDYEIGRKRLIRMWVAEGFAQKTRSKTEEEVANQYFMQLTDRSMIQAIILHARDVVKGCKVHDLMREVATHTMKQEKFGAILVGDIDKAIEKRQRRLSIYDSANIVPPNMGKLNLRSFLMFRIPELSFSACKKLFAKLKLVRVLDLQEVPIQSLPDQVGDLINLRLLNLRGTLIEKLPESLTNLRNLQTLDVRNTNVRSLPNGINMLQQLRHLHMRSFCDRDKGFLKMCKGTICSKGLQTLSGVESDEDLVKELRSLTNLRKLYIGKMTGTDIRELCVCLREMTNLRSLTVVSEHPFENLQFDSVSKPPPSLEKLKLQASMRRLPEWYPSMNCLHTLYMFKNHLEEDPFPILQQLPNLVILTLASSAFLNRNISCNSQGFPKLKLLRIIDIPNWVVWMPIHECTMPNLQYLLIAYCPMLEKLPEGFQHFTALQDLTLTGMSTHFLNRLQGADHRKIHHVREVLIH